MSLDDQNTALFGNGDEPLSNHSANPHMSELIDQRRRQILAGGAAIGALGFLGVLPQAVEAAEHSAKLPFKKRNRLPFEALPVGRADTITVPAGYRASVILPWGTPISGNFPPFLEDASNSAQDQAEQVGMHHDGMHYFPFPGRGEGDNVEANRRGLLCVNHEYTDENQLHGVEGLTGGAGVTIEKVRKSQAAHGVSVMEIENKSRRGA